MDDLKNEIEPGVSNVEIDWFLRGKLPSSTTPPLLEKKTEAKSHHHHHQHTESAAHSPKEDHNLHAHIKPSKLDIKDIDDSNEKIHVLSRSKSSSEVELKNQESKKCGFFRSLFSRSKNGSKEELPTPNSSKSASPEFIDQNHKGDFKTNGTYRTISRARTLSETNSDLDPKLEEFLRYYKAKGLDKLHKDLERPSRRPSVVSISDPSHHQHSDKPVVDALGRPIPPHPDVAPLPPAIVYDSTYQPEQTLHHQILPTFSTNSSTSKITGFLRRHSTVASEASISAAASVSSQRKHPSDESSIVSGVTPNQQQPVTIPGLEDLPKLKRVAFDAAVFLNDPPQQIPSRTPRKGEVEILKDGSIVTHKLSLAEKKQIMNSAGGGIVVGGSGHLKIISTQAEELQKARVNSSDNHVEENDDPNIEEDTEHEAQKHSIGAAAAAAAAEARAKDTPNELKRMNTNNEEEVSVSTGASKINIDKPMVRHNKSSASLRIMGTTVDGNESDGDDGYPPQDAKVPLDLLYTRCCHLREILPIPATLKQIKAGSTDPISLLQLRNPKPSLVEVLTFADFISVAPVLCVSLDGVALSSEMLRIILSSLLYKGELEKLTLRNTPIDELGWRLLCWFLTKNQTLSRLDLTQCPSLTTNVQKPSKTVSNIVRMECNMTNRSDMNWNLLNAALISRKGIEELVINGAKMSDDECRNLFEMGVSIGTSRLGLAYNDLTEAQCEIIAKNLNLEKLVGLDLGYNDLDGKLNALNKRIEGDDVSNWNLKFISLNSTNLQNDDGQLDRLISTFAKFKDLRYIDLSNNKKLFPDLLVSLSGNLPLYPKLARIHLDHNGLQPSDIVAFAELIPFCKSLSYVSLVGNKLDTVSASALTNALKISRSLITLDLNYDEVAPKFRESIGLYTVRNMQQQVYGKQSDPNELQGLQEELSHLLLLDEENPDPKLIERFFSKAVKIRDTIHETIDQLFKLRISGKLSTDGKETLIRFCFIDASIEKGLSLLDKKSAKHGFNCKKYLTPDLDVPIMSRQPSHLLHSSSYLALNDHQELLPFGMASNSQEGEIHADAEEIKDEQAARAQDTKKIKEEASILKLSSYVKSRLDQQDIKPNIDSIQDISGEKFKEVLLQTNDLNNVVEILESMKKEGIPLEKLYERKHCDNNSGGTASAPLLLETLKNTKSNVSDRKTIVSDGESDSQSDADSYISDEAEDENEMNQAYDKILDHLVKVRTNN